MARYRARFADAVADDLATPKALAIAHEVASGAGLADGRRPPALVGRSGPDEAPLPAGAAELLERRAAARATHDYATADALRQALAEMGVEVRDTPAGQEPSVH